MIEVALTLGQGLPTFLILANVGEVSKAEIYDRFRVPDPGPLFAGPSQS